MECRTLVRKFAFIVIAAVSLSHVRAQTSETDTTGGRKVVARVAPAFPDLARKMHIQGAVRIEAVVRPNGQVKSTRVLGGNPVLVEAASDAVKKWKFEPSSNETTEVVQLTFKAQ
jgi:TonB family protein